MSIKFIAAIDANRGIGKNGKLPWDLPNDRAQFYEKVKNGHVLMGSSTYSELRGKIEHIAHCTIFSSHKYGADDIQTVDDPLKYMKTLNSDVWVIGGASIYELLMPFADELHITQIEAIFDCDRYFPEFKKNFSLAEESPPMLENDITYKFQVWKRSN